MKTPKCLILRYYDKLTLKYRKRIIPIRDQITDQTIDNVCDRLIQKHRHYLDLIPRKHVIDLLKLTINSDQEDIKLDVNQSAEELTFNEDEEEFVF